MPPDSALMDVLGHSADPYLIVGHDGCIRTANAAASLLFGFDEPDLIGQPFAQLYSGESGALQARLLGEVLAGAGPVVFEAACLTQAQQLLQTSTSLTPIPASDGRCQSVLVLLRDITQQTLAEAAIRDRTLKLEAIVGYSPSALSLKTPDGRYATANPNLQKIHHLPESAIVGKTDFDLYPEELARTYRANDRLVLDSRSRQSIEELIPVDGQLRTYLSHMFPVLNPDGDVGYICRISLDITDKKRAEAAARKLTQAIEQLPIHVLIASTEGAIEYVNDSFVAFTGYSRAEIVGRNPSLISAGKTPRATYADLWASLKAGKAWRGELINRRRDGGEYIASAIISPIRAEDGTVTHFVAAEEDITQYKQTEAELRQYQQELEDRVDARTRELSQAKEAAEAATVAKSAFLATMSHEIRTPLNALIGTAYLLSHSSLTDEQRGDLDTIETAGRNLLALINDILDISRIEAGELAIDPHTFSLRRLLADVRSLFGQSAAEKGIELNVDATGVDLATGLVGDGHRLRQCLVNLLGNALKFTEAGSVTLTVTRAGEPSAPATVRLRFTVTDTGIGMTAAQQARLFQPFSQADSTTNRRFGGSGLGLSIVKRVAGLMGGSVGVDSAVGAGSTFWIELPFGLTGLPPDVTEDGDGIEHTLKLLIVDSDPRERGTLIRLCTTYGWDAQGVGSDAEMIDRVLASRETGNAVDCVVLDWRPAEPSRLEALATLQARLGEQPVPTVILITAGETAGLSAGTHGTRPDSLLLRPFDPSTLFNAVNAALIAHGFGLDQLLLRSRIANDQTQWLNEVELLVVDDSHLNLDVIGRVLLREGARPTLCESGTEALAALTRHPGRFDAVLMDLQMPVLDGCDTTRQLRRLPECAELPVIALTAGATLSEQQRARDAGMDDFLTKPVDTRLLVRTLRRHVERTRGRPLAVVTKSTPQGVEADRLWPVLPGVSLAEVRHLLGDDPGFYCGLVERFLDEAPALLDAARNHLEQGDPLTAAKALHRLRGQAGNLAAKPLATLAAEMEQHAQGRTLSSAALENLRVQLVRFDQAYKAWAATHREPETTPRPRTGCPVDRDRLHALSEQLKAHDLNAIATFGELADALRETMEADDYRALDKAIGGLQFETAGALLARLPDSA